MKNKITKSKKIKTIDAWYPNRNQEYYFLALSAPKKDMICKTINECLPLDEFNIKNFNCFKTEVEAKLYKEEFLKLLKERILK